MKLFEIICLYLLRRHNHKTRNNNGSITDF
nr:MAG TPA: hypothetical protein [Caudoviricetes sp.]